MSNSNSMLKKQALTAYLEYAFEDTDYTISEHTECKYFFLGYLNALIRPSASDCLALAPKAMREKYTLQYDHSMSDAFIAEWKAKPEFKKWFKRALLRSMQ